MGNSTLPGQNLPPDNYAAQLENITQALVAFAGQTGAKVRAVLPLFLTCSATPLTLTRVCQLLYVKTTAYMCSEVSDGCAINLNNQADAIMVKYGIPTVNPHDAIIGWCGPVPNTHCFGVGQCFCPHCPGVGYEHLAGLLAPVIRAMLSA